jgi:hypothetical protein
LLLRRSSINRIDSACLWCCVGGGSASKTTNCSCQRHISVRASTAWSSRTAQRTQESGLYDRSITLFSRHINSSWSLQVHWLRLNTIAKKGHAGHNLVREYEMPLRVRTFAETLKLYL